MSKGKFYLLFSAFLYGVLPALTAIAYKGGVNGITLTFLRSAVSLPLLYVIIKADKRSLKVTRKQLRDISLLSIFGGVMPILSLYMSYNYISTGLATTLHFIYPIIIVIASAVLYREKISRLTLSAVVIATVGIFMFTDVNAAADKTGIVLAVLSGIFYSFYVIFMDKSGLYKLDFIVLTFYLAVVMSISMFIFGVMIHGISFDISPLSWSFSILISIIVTLGAMPLLQVGIKYEGATTAGILSTVEPITSIIIGAVFLGEIIGAGQIIGVALILLGVLISQKKQVSTTEAPQQ